MKSKRREKYVCWNKIQYLNLAAAVYAANTKGAQYKRKFWPYRCSICKKWHLTSHEYDDNVIVGDVQPSTTQDEEIELTEADFIEVMDIKKEK